MPSYRSKTRSEKSLSLFMGQTQAGASTPRRSPTPSQDSGQGDARSIPITGAAARGGKPPLHPGGGNTGDKTVDTRQFVAENFHVSFPPSPTVAHVMDQTPGNYGGNAPSRGVVGSAASRTPSNVMDDNTRPVDAQKLLKDPETVLTPTVFTWNHGGHNVYLTGSFNAWQDRLPMHRSGNDFTYILELPAGNHQYKFVVDNDWMCAPDQQTVRDDIGNVNNFVEVTPVRSSEAEPAYKGSKHAQLAYGNYCPSREELPLKEPPQLPPHLKHVVLNCPVDLNDPNKLPLPQHVTLDHLYCASKRNDGTNYTLIGISQRYKNKFVTTIYYKPTDVPLPSNDIDEDDMEVDII